jgi:hypothetical protein
MEYTHKAFRKPGAGVRRRQPTAKSGISVFCKSGRPSRAFFISFVKSSKISACAVESLITKAIEADY